MAKSKFQFPLKIYATSAEEPGESASAENIMAWRNLENADEGTVAVYKLELIAKHKCIHELK